MKKALAILLALSVLALSACAAKQVNSDTQKDVSAETAAPSADPEQTEDAQQSAQEAKRVEPLPETLDVNARPSQQASARRTSPKKTARRRSP